MELKPEVLNKEWLLNCYLNRSDQSLFLDIETEGISKEKNDITVIGIFYRGAYRAFIKGLNLTKAYAFLAQVPIWITFNGEMFDLPFVKRKFPDLCMPEVHIDLYQLSGLFGLKGGLKKIEKDLGIFRQTEGMNGFDAVKLWRRWEELKDRDALRQLILYNKEDVVNLKKIMERLLEINFRKKKRSHLGG